MLNDRFDQLMARKLSGEASAEELLELEAFIDEYPQARYFHDMMLEYWTVEPKNQPDDIQEEIHFQQLISIAEKKHEEAEPALVRELPASRRRKLVGGLLIAACLLGLVIGARYLMPANPAAQPSSVALREVATDKGARTHLVLPDGTRVWLNSESHITYKGNFDDSVREVTLEGEAYFDVVKDAKHPFIVHTSEIDIRVLGTAFNVKSYPRDEKIEATLIHGLIEVTNKKEPTAPKVILRPHEKLVVSKATKTEAGKTVTEAATAAARKPFFISALPRNIADTAVAETSWVYNKLIFDGESFREIADKMERWYNVRINFRSEKLEGARFYYQIDKESVEEALTAMSEVIPFGFEKKGNEIVIYKK